MKLVTIFAIIFSFTQCKSLKLEDNPPFIIDSATQTALVGGKPGNTSVNVTIAYTSNKTIQFDSVYFMNRVAKLQASEAKGKKMLTGNIVTSAKRDLVLNSDSKKEINNTVPEADNFPFELKENEAVISYKQDDKIYYYKIKSLRKGKTVFYPSAPK